MLRQSTHAWEDTIRDEGLLYFAQRSIEMLFDYAMDRYKIYVVSTAKLAQELCWCAKNEGTDDKNIKHVLQELKNRFQHDTASRMIIGDYLGSYLSIDENNKDDIIAKSSLIYHKLISPNAKNKCEAFLRQAIISKKKSDIDSFSVFYYGYLLNAGYSKSYIYENIKKTFFYRRRGVKHPDTLIKFLEAFTEKNNQYDVYLCIADSAKEYHKLIIPCSFQHVTVSDIVDTTLKDKIGELFSDDLNSIFKIKITSLDPYSATAFVHKLVQKISNIISIYDHKSKMRPLCSFVVAREDEIKKIRFMEPFIRVSENMRPHNAVETATRLASGLRLDWNSFSRFERVVEMHGNALNSSNTEGQLLNIWSCFETLINENGGTKGVAKIAEAIIPFQNIFYFIGIIDDISRSIFRWNKNIVSEAMQHINFYDDISTNEKTACLICCNDESTSKARNFLLKKCGDFYILRNRIHMLNSHMSSTKSLLRMLKMHTEKVDWQIRRIYRARNSIVHAGGYDLSKESGSSLLEGIVENAHKYLDKVIQGISAIVIDEQSAVNIQHAILEVSIRASAQIEILEKINGNITPDNVCQAIFGTSKKIVKECTPNI